MKKESSLNPLLKHTFWLMIFTGFFGVALPGISIAGGILFPYRAFLLLLIVLIPIDVLMKSRVSRSALNRVIFPSAFLVFWFFYAFASFFWVASIEAWGRNLFFLGSGITVVLSCYYCIRSEKDEKVFFFLWILASVFLMIIGCWEVLTGNHLSVSSYVDAPSWKRNMPSSVFYNTNEFAPFLTLSISFYLGLLRMNSRFARLSGSVLIVVSLFLLSATKSRANMLAVATIFVFWFLPFLRSIRTRWARVFLGGVLLCSLVAGAVLLFNSSEIKSLMHEATAGQGSGGIRLNLIKNSLYFLLGSGGLGVGAGNAEWYMENRGIFDTAGVTNVHNWWVELLVNYGLLVTTLYFMLYFYVVWNSWGILRSKVETQWKSIFFQTIYLGSIGFFLASISSSSIMAFAPIWFFWGMALSFLALDRKKDRRRQRKTMIDAKFII